MEQDKFIPREKLSKKNAENSTIKNVALGARSSPSHAASNPRKAITDSAKKPRRAILIRKQYKVSQGCGHSYGQTENHTISLTA